jgi:Tol biopolymer transport system component
MKLRLALSLTALLCTLAATAQTTRPFTNPQRVTLTGYDGDIMEPFLSRDGRYLFFNNLNEPPTNTNLFYAERVDDLHFRFRGELQGINTPALEAVASLDSAGDFYFVSNRSYDTTASTLYRGHFDHGVVTAIELVPGVSLAKGGIVNFDAEISADGNTLYFVEAQFGFLGPNPKSAKILIAHRNGSTFARDPNGEAIMKNINTAGLNYAPALTANELEIFFTRADAHGPAIFQSTRISTTQPFSPPTRIASITGFVEAPTLSPDGNALYFHKKENDRFVLYRVTR